MILEYTLSTILITTHFIAVLIFLDKVRRRKIEITNDPNHQIFWFQAFAEMPPNFDGGTSTLKGYPRYKWQYYYWKTAFLDILLKRRTI